MIRGKNYFKQLLCAPVHSYMYMYIVYMYVSDLNSICSKYLIIKYAQSPKDHQLTYIKCDLWNQKFNYNTAMFTNMELQPSRHKTNLCPSITVSNVEHFAIYGHVYTNVQIFPMPAVAKIISR